MNKALTSQQKNAVLISMAKIITEEKSALLEANKTDVKNYSGDDLAMTDRLKVDNGKIDGMIL